MANYKNISKSLDRCFDKGFKMNVEIDNLRWIIFSDHHRGRKDGADDFLVCEKTYVNALQHYHNDDYTLCLLGDVEEFWENPFLSVMIKYKEVLQLEKMFYDKDRLHKIWGNHDDAWRFAGTIRKHLGWLFPNIVVYESILLNVTDRGTTVGEIFMVHGHQGSAESDRFSGISKFFVKYIWRNFQRLFKVPLSTPANNLELKSQHDLAMYQWASNKQKTLICGHTHKPVFVSMTLEEKLMHEIDNLKDALLDKEKSIETHEKMKQLLHKVELYMAENPSNNSDEKKHPYYFNSGCCSFSDGDITGIELADGMIRLIKWNSKDNNKEVLEELPLHHLFTKT